MIYLDTHIVIWLYAGQTELLSPQAYRLINASALWISPLVRLELTYLHEIGRIQHTPPEILADLQQRLGLKICNKRYASVVEKAAEQTWTRDPFDRLIVGQAAVNKNVLVSKDTLILTHYAQAIW